MFNLETFATENIGKKVGYDAADEGQCTGLVNNWLVANDLPPIICNAIAFQHVNNSAYEFIKNTPEGVPSAGDIVVFNIGEDGHVDIFVSGNNESFKGLDQNWPVGSAVEYVEHNYNDVIGWVHPKAFTAVPVFPRTVTVTVPELNVRVEPNDTAAVSSTLKEGSTFEAVEEVTGGEYEVNGQTSSQWIKSSFGHYVASLGLK